MTDIMFPSNEELNYDDQLQQGESQEQIFESMRAFQKVYSDLLEERGLSLGCIITGEYLARKRVGNAVVNERLDDD